MARHPHQTVDPVVIKSIRNFSEFRAAVDGLITFIKVQTDVAPIADVAIQFTLNGVTLDNVTLIGGTTSVEASGLSHAVLEGDKIVATVSFLSPFNHVGPKTYFTLFIEDGFPSYFGGSSVTSFAIGTGSKAFTVAEGLAYTVGSRVRLASSASPTTNYMAGVVTAYSGTTLTVLVDLAVGSGTHTDWLLSIAGEKGDTGATGPTGPTGLSGTNGTNGTNGTGGAIWRSGVGVPSNSLGVDGDFYLNTTASTIYERVSGAYVLRVTLGGGTSYGKVLTTANGIFLN